jgi:adenylate cyclase
MATFGSLEHQTDAPASALAWAFALLQEIGRWNAKRAQSGGSPVSISIGVRCGPVTVGNLGGARVEFTVGDGASDLTPK